MELHPEAGEQSAQRQLGRVKWGLGRGRELSPAGELGAGKGGNYSCSSPL
jgi:hypothetical protein